MLPVLLDLRFLKIYTFGIFLVLAFFWACFLVWKLVRLTSHKEEEVFDAIFVSIPIGLIAGRIMYIATHFDKFGFDIWRYILINGYPGLVLYGCVIGFFLGIRAFFAINKVKFSDVIDYLVPPALLALAIGKLGSFFAGVELGTKTTFPIAIKYANADGLRHLTALYEGLLFFLGAFVAYKILFAIRREKYRKGFLFSCFFWYFALVTASFDSLKVSHINLGPVSLNSILSWAILLTLSIYLGYYFRCSIFSRLSGITNLIITHGFINTFRRFHRTAEKKT
ncbi:prolipoprotein diacylglyceryl transferase [Candidatus Roizmanbacteria bacterium]|nr:prolipoprotein diacylglyceryl transferase [Candidatus Roizmanbacteria bacterium]